MRLARVSAFALLAGCSLFVPAALADEPSPAPAPPAPGGPPAPPAPGPDDIQRAIHEAEVKLKEAIDAGREREEAAIRATLDRMRAARKEAQLAREKMVASEKARHDKDIADATEKLITDPTVEQAFRSRVVDVLHAVVEQDGKLVLDGGDGQVLIFGDVGGDDAPSNAQIAALKLAQAGIRESIRTAEQAGDTETVERLRRRASIVGANLEEMMSRASREGGGAGGPVRYYRQLEFKAADPAAAGVADLDRRLAALRQAAKLLKEAGMADRVRGLQEDIGRLERERALAVAAAQAGGGGADASGLAKEVHALREQVEALRHELREMRAMLEKAIAK